ncbi:putative Gp5 [uncultured Mycobacterium sp.]|uniref:Putative Gp5 n=1 Tax=uncultured Mycobacterium sp. TaxID=171292 RepID=A0A1Y5P1R8_9MYCO|nr:putative Gp5 [uncultured Mycobacterium sp.]SBS78929.1 putative Gp5 [uncultured Mycobacterium sp.]
MTALDEAVEALQALLQRLQDAAAVDVENLWRIVTANLIGWDPADRQAVIAALAEHLPDVLGGHVAAVADVTTTWYDMLAPDEPFTAAVPPGDLVPAERIRQSISWAVNTATSTQTALAQLQGTVQRGVVDAQRATVAHNAAAEGVRYRRHTNYAGACNWCLTMATRGAIYITAISAVKGHDNCKCIAVPERKGTSYIAPAMVRDAEKRYAEASRQLKAEGKPATLDSIVARMDRLAT